ncbi:MAG: serine/threonine-protein kinase, partial [Polyangiales bacterium]
PIVDFVHTADGRPALITELLEGEDLQARLKRVQRLPLDEALAFTMQICAALQHAHTRGVVHRDLKPSNVFLLAGDDAAVDLKLLDFGVAKSSADAGLTATGATVGTPSYMAPEQATGARHVDARADIYAAGAILYRMLTGTPPHSNAEAGSCIAQLLSTEAVPPRTLNGRIPIAVEATIQKAMARDPAERFTDAASFAQALQALRQTPPAPHAVAISGAFLRQTPKTEQEATTRSAPRARLWSLAAARPLAALTALAGALCGGALGLQLLVALVRALRPTAVQLTVAEHTLVLTVTAALGLSVLATLMRGFKPHWRSAPALMACTRRLSHWLALSLLTLGGAGLLQRTVLAAFGHLQAPSPLWQVVGVLAAIGLPLWRHRQHR